MPPKKRRPGNKNSKGAPKTVNIKEMSHEEYMAHKVQMKKISSKK